MIKRAMEKRATENQERSENKIPLSETAALQSVLHVLERCCEINPAC